MHNDEHTYKKKEFHFIVGGKKNQIKKKCNNANTKIQPGFFG